MDSFYDFARTDPLKWGLLLLAVTIMVSEACNLIITTTRRK
jgi:hypothetical protein